VGEYVCGIEVKLELRMASAKCDGRSCGFDWEKAEVAEIVLGLIEAEGRSKVCLGLAA